MIRHKYLSSVMLLVALALLAGCRDNPDVQKARYLESGKRFSTEGKYREAAIQFLNALKVDKNYPEAHYELAEAFEHLGHSAEASTELARTVELQPANFKARVELGDLLFADGRTDQAQVQAYAVMAKQPTNPGVHALLSAISARQGKMDQALAEIRRAVELDPNRATFHENLALLLEDDHSDDASVEAELKRAIELDSKSLNAKLLLASFYSRNNRMQEAEKISWDAVAADPDSLTARENVAQVILKEGDRARAEKVLSQASKDLTGDAQGVRVLADYYTESGELDKAVAEFSRLVMKYPESLSLQKGYIQALLQARNYTAARTAVDRLLKKSPRDPEVAKLNGLVLLEDGGKPSDAVNALLASARTFPDDSSIQYWLGRAAMEAGDHDLAEKSFLQATGLNPAEEGAQEGLAHIARQRGDIGMLGDVADNAIAAMPRYAGAYVWRAIVEMDRNLPDKAEADLKTAMALAPQSAQPYLNLGKLRFVEKRFPEGVDILEQALQNNPNSVGALRLLVSFDLYQRQPQKAVARVEAQIEKSPNNSHFYDLLAELEIQDKHLDSAATSVEKAIQLSPGDGDAVMLYAQIAVGRGKIDNAIASWEQWSNAHPNDADALAILGTLEESRGNAGKAEAYYRRALQIQPQRAIAANNLAYRMLQNGGDVTTAMTLAQTARQGMPDSPNTADTLAWAYYSNGTYEFARYLLEDAISTDPNSATMQYHLGMVYWKLLDHNNAVIHLRKAVSLGRGSQTARDAQMALQGIS